MIWMVNGVSVRSVCVDPLQRTPGEAGIKLFVDSEDDSYDNAFAETINGLYKVELIHRLAL